MRFSYTLILVKISALTFSSSYIKWNIYHVFKLNILGTRAPPREIAFDKSIIVTDPYPGDVRVATPPRTLTLDRYPFPEFQDEEPETSVISKLNHSNDLDFLTNNRGITPTLGGNLPYLSKNFLLEIYLNNF